MFCPKCGKAVSEGSSFCQHCGESISSTQSGMQTFSAASNLTNEDFAAFVGKNSEKYLPKFAKFNVGGIDSFRATWHWPAFFFPFWWMLYRKLYGWAILAFFLAIIPYFGLITIFVWAITANRLYYNHAKKKIIEIRQLHPAPETQKAVIAATGGTGNAALIAGIIIVGLMIIAILAAIAIPQFSAYRARAYNAAALSDLNKARTICEEYYTNNARYPLTLDETGFQPTNGVQVNYKSVDENRYIIHSKHSNGTKLYQITSNELVILERDANSTESPFVPLK